MKPKLVLIVLVVPILTEGIAVGVPIPQDVKQAVTFIFVPDESDQPKPHGTGFFIGVTNEQDPNRVNLYLVTAKHVLTQKKTKSFFNHVWVRMNKKRGGSQRVKIPLSGVRAARVYTHEDPNVDIAVIPVPPDPNIFDFKYIPEKLITTREMFEDLKVAEGDEIFFVGLFTGYYGIERNYPIVRFGRVALITDEKIPWGQTKDGKSTLLNLYLIETQSFGGSSGSPVFFWLDPTRDPKKLVFGAPKLFLGGVMIGHYSGMKPVELLKTNAFPLAARENLGIAGVIPAYSLHEILFSDEVKNRRQVNKTD